MRRIVGVGSSPSCVGWDCDGSRASAGSVGEARGDTEVRERTGKASAQDYVHAEDIEPRAATTDDVEQRCGDNVESGSGEPDAEKNDDETVCLLTVAGVLPAEPGVSEWHDADDAVSDDQTKDGEWKMFVHGLGAATFNESKPSDRREPIRRTAWLDHLVIV